MKRNDKTTAKAAATEPKEDVPVAININGMIEQAGKKLEGLQSWVEFEEMGFLFNFLPRAKFKKLAQNCTMMKYDPGQRQRVETVDSEKLNDLLVRAVVVDWKKVNPRNLSKVTSINVSSVPEDRLDEDLEFDIDTVKLLAEHAYGFEQFLQDVCMDQSYFQPEAEEELKNSEASQTGN